MVDTGAGDTSSPAATLRVIGAELAVLERRITADLQRMAELLNQAKAAVPAGMYQLWVKKTLKISPDTAERIRNAGRFYGAYPQLAGLVGNTSAAELANASPEVIEEIIDLTRGGRALKNWEVRAIVVMSRRAAKVAERYGASNVRTAAELTRLAVNNSSTINEVELSGYIQPGDEGAAVPINAPPAQIEAAIKSKQRAHYELANDQKAANQRPLFVRGVETAENGFIFGVFGFADENEAAEAIKRLIYGRGSGNGNSEQNPTD